MNVKRWGSIAIGTGAFLAIVTMNGTAGNSPYGKGQKTCNCTNQSVAGFVLHADEVTVLNPYFRTAYGNFSTGYGGLPPTPVSVGAGQCMEYVYVFTCTATAGGVYECKSDGEMLTSRPANPGECP